MKINSLCILAMISVISIIFLSTSFAHAQTLDFESYNATNPMTSQFNHTLALEKQARQYYPNDTQTSMAVKLAENSTQFQSLINGYNYTFVGIFEYLGLSTPPAKQNSLYAVDFSLYEGPRGHFPLPKMLVTVWLDSTLTKILNVTSSGMGWIGGPGGPLIGPEIESLCDKSYACYLRYFSIPPPEAASICDTTLGCYIVGPHGSSDQLATIHVPEFPIAIIPLVIGLMSAVIFYRIKFKF